MEPGRGSDGEWVRWGSAPMLDGMEFARARYFTHRFPVHVHDDYVIGAVVDGAKSSRHGGRMLSAGAGELMLLNPFEEHTSEGLSPSWTWAAVYPSRRLIETWFGQRTFATPVLRAPEAVGRILALHRTLEAGAPALASEELLAGLAGPLLAPAPVDDADPGAILRRVRERLDADLEQDVGLSELAAIAGLTPPTLLRAFRRAFGCTPHVYRTARRLMAAKLALRRGRPPAEVAVEAGFCDQSHLNRVFRRWIGTTPAAFAAAPLCRSRQPA